MLNAFLLIATFAFAQSGDADTEIDAYTAAAEAMEDGVDRGDIGELAALEREPCIKNAHVGMSRQGMINTIGDVFNVARLLNGDTSALDDLMNSGRGRNTRSNTRNRRSGRGSSYGNSNGYSRDGVQVQQGTGCDADKLEGVVDGVDARMDRQHDMDLDNENHDFMSIKQRDKRQAEADAKAKAKADVEIASVEQVKDLAVTRLVREQSQRQGAERANKAHLDRIHELELQIEAEKAKAAKAEAGEKLAIRQQEGMATAYEEEIDLLSDDPDEIASLRAEAAEAKAKASVMEARALVAEAAMKRLANK